MASRLICDTNAPKPVNFIMPRLTIAVPDKVAQPYRFSLDRQIVYFGRGDDNDIHIDSPSVSSEHAVMERIIGGYILTDLGSTNGIKLNGERVNKIHLRNDQNIHIGDAEFTFQLSDEEMSALRKEDPTSHLPPIDEPPPPQKQPEEMSPPVPTSPEIHLRDESPTDDDSIRIEEVAPQPRPQRQPAPEPHSKPPVTVSQGSGSNYTGLIVLLAVIAFVTGVAMHFQRSTKVSLLEAIQYKLSGGE